jgi:hypothetical protein
MMYVDQETSFQKQHFQMFCNVVEEHSYTITQECVTDLNTGSKSLPSESVDTLTWSIHYPTSSKKLSVSKADFDGVMEPL